MSFVFVKIGIGKGSPFVFLFYKFIIAAICLAIVFAKQLKNIKVSTLKIGVSLGVPLLLGTAFQTISLSNTTVSNSAFITGLDVLLIPIFKLLFYKKTVKPKVWFSCILALSGLYIIAVKDGFKLNSGDLWAVACAFGFAFYVLQSGKYSKEKFPMLAVIVAMFFCAIGCFVIASLNPSSQLLPNGAAFWKGVLFAAIPATAYMYAIQNYGQRYLEEEKIALAYLFEPIFATIAGVFLLGEDFGFRTVVGGLFIFVAMLVAEISLVKKGNNSFSNANSQIV